MSDELDLRGVQMRHEPDPEFRAALRRRVEEIVAAEQVSDRDRDGDVVELTLGPVRTRRRRSRSALVVASVAAAVVVIALVATRPSDESSVSTATTTVAGDPAVAKWCDQQARGLANLPIPQTGDEVFGYSAAMRHVVTEPPPELPPGATQPVTDADPVGTPYERLTGDDTVGTLDAATALAVDRLYHVDQMWRNTHLEVSQTLAREVQELTRHRLAAIAVAGEPCAMFDPSDAAASRLDIPFVGGAAQITSAFGTLWIARQFTDNGGEIFADAIVRLAPDTGEIVGIIDVGDSVTGMQAADGRMWVHTSDRTIVAVDPETNTISSTIQEWHVAPDADPAWAVDGALWLCDGDRLLRYDPVTSQTVAVVELDLDCGQVYATDELVVASTDDEDDRTSGPSAAALIDPETNAVLHTVDLPVEAFRPVVLEDELYVPGNGTERAVTIDRATGAVAEAPALSAPVGGGQPAFDGEFIYLPARDTNEILVVDADTLEVSEVLPTLGVNSVALHDSELWTANDVAGFVQAIPR